MPSVARGDGISTHALTWRATQCWQSFGWSPPNFYPRPHMEGDLQQIDRLVDLLQISTHALTWRATGTTIEKTADFDISTHALTWRATMCAD